jgi:hypothetical protein
MKALRKTRLWNPSSRRITYLFRALLDLIDHQSVTPYSSEDVARGGSFVGALKPNSSRTREMDGRCWNVGEEMRRDEMR